MEGGKKRLLIISLCWYKQSPGPAGCVWALGFPAVASAAPAHKYLWLVTRLLSAASLCFISISAGSLPCRWTFRTASWCCWLASTEAAATD